MKLLMSIPVALIILNACNVDSNNKNITPSPTMQKKNHKIVNPKYEAILNGLNKCYILNIDENHKKDLLQFYRKDDSTFINDSIQYHQSVRDFYFCDTSIVNYLVKNFIYDTTLCGWIYSHHPYSSTISKWELTFTKKQGAAVLVFNYFENIFIESNLTIITSPIEVGRIIDRVNLDAIKNWLLKNKSCSPTELKQKFIENFS